MYSFVSPDSMYKPTHRVKVSFVTLLHVFLIRVQQVILKSLLGQRGHWDIMNMAEYEYSWRQNCTRSCISRLQINNGNGHVKTRKGDIIYTPYIEIIDSETTFAMNARGKFRTFLILNLKINCKTRETKRCLTAV